MKTTSPNPASTRLGLSDACRHSLIVCQIADLYRQVRELTIPKEYGSDLGVPGSEAVVGVFSACKYRELRVSLRVRTEEVRRCTASDASATASVVVKLHYGNRTSIL